LFISAITAFPQPPNGPGLVEPLPQIQQPAGQLAGEPTDNQNPSSTNYPDQEDLNRDRSLNETEAYFRYKIDLKNLRRPGSA
jgi:hypothetical protein